MKKHEVIENMKIQEFIESFREGSKSRKLVDLLKSGRKIETREIKERMNYALITVLARQINARDFVFKIESSHTCRKWYWQLKKVDEDKC